MELNKKEYPDNGIFIEEFNEKYYKLEIYPLVGILEKEAGLLSEIAENLKNYTYCFYDDKKLEDYLFLVDNLKNFEKNNNYYCISIVWVNDSFTNYESITGEYILCKENEYLNKSFKYRYSIGSKVLYLNDYSFFMKYFYYYFNGQVFNYDNLICYTMIVKNAGPLLEQVLTENLPIIDRWCILDTGSTDGTQEVIKRVLKDKKGTLYEEPFVDFKVSRNRCLDLAGTSCKFTLMLDDTYSMRGDLRKFLNEVRGDQVSDSFSLIVQSGNTEYYSNRITKSKNNLRYIHTIHEIIDDKNNVDIGISIFNEQTDAPYILDYHPEYMEKRRNDRKQLDLELLFKELDSKPNDPRTIYYIAQTYGCIGDIQNKIKYLEKRIELDGFIQEKIESLIDLGILYHSLNKPWKECEKIYLQAYELDKKRPEAFYFIGFYYYLNNNYKTAYDYLKKSFNIGYPIESQYSLKWDISFNLLPKLLSEVCYYVGDYSLGISCADFFLNNKYNKDISDKIILEWRNKNLNAIKR
jgi:tetratricopeptide (TPR) repeat protein